VIKNQPSAKTKSKILNGNEIITGDNINIPKDNRIFETTISMTMNGKKITKEILKAVASSEIM